MFFKDEKSLENFKSIIVNELFRLTTKRYVKWKRCSSDEDDFMTTAKYQSEKDNRGRNKSHNVMYRVCKYGSKYYIFIHDYDYKTISEQSTFEFPRIEISDDKETAGGISDIFNVIKEVVEYDEERLQKELYEKLKICLNFKD
ncbi:MAG: hypothetical protein IJ193_00830 [Bacilli bacterium]|nr:hypothetical protein [Bacilli bacterium]